MGCHHPLLMLAFWCHFGFLALCRHHSMMSKCLCCRAGPKLQFGGVLVWQLFDYWWNFLTTGFKENLQKRPIFSLVPLIFSLLYSGGFRGGAPYSPKCSQFHAVFRKIWQNHILVPPPGGLAPLLWGILDPPLTIVCHYNPLTDDISGGSRIFLEGAPVIRGGSRIFLGGQFPKYFC